MTRTDGRGRDVTGRLGHDHDGCRTSALGFADVLETLDTAAVRRWCATGLDRLRSHRHEIDELNVYPVPDGDTGTNLVLTMTAAAEAIDGVPDGPDERHSALGRLLHLLARGALLGARGNSGVILSQIFGGMADGVTGADAAGAVAYAAALDRAATAARQAVADPVEGTILTVARAAADAAAGPGRAADAVDGLDRAAAAAADRAVARAGSGPDDPGWSLAAAVAASADAARAALARTPEQLPALARAGVVDAGGRGLVVLLDALVEVVVGAPPSDAGPPPGRGDGRPGRSDVDDRGGGVPAAPWVKAGVAAMRETGSDRYGYEVQYLLDAPESAVAALRAGSARAGRLAGRGRYPRPRPGRPYLERARARQRRRRGDRGGRPGGPPVPDLGDPVRRSDRAGGAVRHRGHDRHGKCDGRSTWCRGPRPTPPTPPAARSPLTPETPQPPPRPTTPRAARSRIRRTARWSSCADGAGHGGAVHG